MEEQKMLIPCKGQKVNIREIEHLTFKAQKSWTVTSTTYVNTENKPKDLHPYINKLIIDMIRKQNEQYL